VAAPASCGVDLEKLAKNRFLQITQFDSLVCQPGMAAVDSLEIQLDRSPGVTPDLQIQSEISTDYGEIAIQLLAKTTLSTLSLFEHSGS
jgi:hypothetical protein